ncbi:MAG: hypothetical protein JWN48_2740 [Myxococcaceae bacterium]|nr:hypothetical protein [Myxococcaceae bacterium]
MGIARAIRRVKRQAKQGGLNAVIEGLGEGLRSRSVPAPLRGAARKIASLIDPTRSARKGRPGSSPAAHASTRSAAARATSADPYLEPAPGSARTPTEVTATGVDSGAEPSEPSDDMLVDAQRVGATPTYNATPVEVAPVDASPSEVAKVVVKPVEVSLHDLPAVEAELNEESELSEAASIEGQVHAPQAETSPKKSPAKKPKTPEATKEKLAADGGAAKSVARSGSSTSKKGAGARAGKTSKKK